MDRGVLFQGCRLEVGGLLGGPMGGGMVHGRCSVKLSLGTGGVVPCQVLDIGLFFYEYHRFLQFLILDLRSGSFKFRSFFFSFHFSSKMEFKKEKKKKKI